MSKEMTGGCLCGAVRYKITGEPQFGGKCYCEDCRKTSGTGHVAVLAVGEDGVEVKGTLSKFAKTGSSGQPITRHFCPTCGSQVYVIAAAMPSTVMVRASTLDDPSAFESQMSIFVSRAPAWDRPPAGSVTFDEMPPPQ